MSGDRSVYAVALVAVVMGAAIASPAAAASPARADRALDRALDRVVDVPGGPAGVISLVRRGGRTFVHRAGVADLWPPAWRAVTLGQALHHTSGLPDFTRSAGYQADLGANLLRRFTPRQLLDYVAGDRSGSGPAPRTGTRTRTTSWSP